MRILRVTGVLFILATFVLGLAGCNVSSSVQPAATPSAAPAAPVVATPPTVMKASMAIAGRGSLVYLPAAIAEFGGYFKEEGLEVTINEVKGGADSVKALISKSVDFAPAAFEHAIKAQLQGQDVVLVNLFVRLNAVALVVDIRHKDTIKTIKDLKGKRVGVTSLGSGTHQALISLMQKEGMAEGDIEAVAAGTIGQAAAMENGSIVGAINGDPQVTEAVLSGKAYFLADMITKEGNDKVFGGDYPFIGLMVRRETLTKDPELVARMVRAHAKALGFIVNNDAKTVMAKLPAEWKTNAALYEAALIHHKPAYAPLGLIDQSGVDNVVRALKSAKIIEANAVVKAQELYDMSMLNKFLGK